MFLKCIIPFQKGNNYSGFVRMLNMLKIPMIEDLYFFPQLQKEKEKTPHISILFSEKQKPTILRVSGIESQEFQRLSIKVLPIPLNLQFKNTRPR